jgi:hypothetical protein
MGTFNLDKRGLCESLRRGFYVGLNIIKKEILGCNYVVGRGLSKRGGAYDM